MDAISVASDSDNTNVPFFINLRFLTKIQILLTI